MDTIDCLLTHEEPDRLLCTSLSSPPAISSSFTPVDLELGNFSRTLVFLSVFESLIKSLSELKSFASPGSCCACAAVVACWPGSFSLGTVSFPKICGGRSLLTSALEFSTIWCRLVVDAVEDF